MKATKAMYDWFANSVARHGDRQIALEVAGEAVTYAALDAISARLADELGAAHGGVPARVGLLAARSAAACAGYLAVQCLGATVVPLSPAWAASRNAAISADAGLDFVITEDGTGLDARSVELSTDRMDSLRASPVPALRRRRRGPTASSTSCSRRARPGVPIAHRNVSAYLSHVIPRYELGWERGPASRGPSAHPSTTCSRPGARGNARRAGEE